MLECSYWVKLIVRVGKDVFWVVLSWMCGVGGFFWRKGQEVRDERFRSVKNGSKARFFPCYALRKSWHPGRKQLLTKKLIHKNGN